MWTQLTKLTGTLWIAFGAWFIVTELIELPSREFQMGWAYYASLWAFLALCVIAGALLLSGQVIGKWLVTTLAVLLAIYAVVLLGKADGAPLLYQLWCVVMAVFSVWSICLVQRRNA